jgi:hypothetical protein
MPLKLTLSKALSGAAACLVLAGCGKNEPQYYEVQQPEPAPQASEQMSAAHAGHDHAAMAAAAERGPGFGYTAPEAWRAVDPGNMQILSFEAGSAVELPVQFSVSAFPGDVGGQVANINRWRRQVGLGPMDPAVVSDFVEELQISGMPAWEVDFTGPAGSGSNGGAARVRVAVVSHNGQSWFFKLTGNDAAVADELANYRAFLETVQF